MFVAVGLGSFSSTAWADTSFSLAWRSKLGTTACVSEPALRSAVEQKLRRSPFADPDRADIAIEGEELAAPAGRFRARVKQTDRNGVVLGSRELDAESCARLLRATTIVVALFIDPGNDGGPDAGGGGSAEAAARDAGDEAEARDAGATTATGEPAGLDAVEPDGSSIVRPRPARADVAPTVTRSPPFDLVLGAGGAAAIGLLPSANAMVRVVARLERQGSRLSFEWSGGYSLPQSFRTRAVRGTFAAVDQQLRACVTLGPLSSRARFETCGGAFWGAIVPQTAGERARNDTWRPLAGPLAAVAVELRDGPRAMRLDLGMAVPLVRRNLYFESSAGEVERVHSNGRVIPFLGFSGLFTIL